MENRLGKWLEEILITLCGGYCIVQEGNGGNLWIRSQVLNIERNEWVEEIFRRQKLLFVNELCLEGKRAGTI